MEPPFVVPQGRFIAFLYGSRTISMTNKPRRCPTAGNLFDDRVTPLNSDFAIANPLRATTNVDLRGTADASLSQCLPLTPRFDGRKSPLKLRFVCPHRFVRGQRSHKETRSDHNWQINFESSLYVQAHTNAMGSFRHR